MGQIDDDAQLIHAFDRLPPEGRQPAIDLAGVAAAIITVLAKRERQTAQPEVEKRLKQIQTVA